MANYNSNQNKYRTHPGDLRHIVEIGYTESIVNNNGYPEPTHKILCKVWASAKESSNQVTAEPAANAALTERTVNFVIRYRSDVKAGMWVLFQGEKWEIKSINEYSFRKDYITLKTTQTKGVSG